LCPEGQLWVDVDAFEEAASIAKRVRDPAAYRAAIDLYTGDLLPEDRYEEWAEERRRQLHQLCLGLILEQAELYEGREEHAPAIQDLRRAINKEPTLEEAHVALMRLQALSGRPDRALDQYEKLSHTLATTLDKQPAETTRYLRDEIADGRFLLTSPVEPRQEEESSDHGHHNLPSVRASFVGRGRELLEVEGLLATTRLLTLTGVGGSGKTRLALEVARNVVQTYPGGVWLVRLAPLSDPALVVQAGEYLAEA
jgi:tetratricopeptide (TPR) repeat protein